MRSSAQTISSCGPVPVQHARDVDVEAVVPAAMGGDLAAVHPDLGVVVDRAEVQQQPLALPAVRHGEGPAVPHPVLVPLDSGQRRLDRVRHQDLLGQWLARSAAASPRLAAGELPEAVEVLPLRSRVSCGRGYSGSALVGETSSVQGVLSGGVPVCQPLRRCYGCGLEVPAASAVAASKPQPRPQRASAVVVMRFMGVDLSWAEKGRIRLQRCQRRFTKTQELTQKQTSARQDTDRNRGGEGAGRRQRAGLWCRRGRW